MSRKIGGVGGNASAGRRRDSRHLRALETRTHLLKVLLEVRVRRVPKASSALTVRELERDLRLLAERLLLRRRLLLVDLLARLLQVEHGPLRLGLGDVVLLLVAVVVLQLPHPTAGEAPLVKERAAGTSARREVRTAAGRIVVRAEEKRRQQRSADENVTAVRMRARQKR
jgi:hypothetical protein